jgi:hypothetical protein
MAIQELLRQELMEFQKSQSELLRWKLVAIGGVFGLAFTHPQTTLVLIVVPLVAVYCDLLYRNYDIRIALISWHLAEIDEGWRAYENSLSGSPWFLNSGATLLASLGACVCAAVAGYIGHDRTMACAVAYFSGAGFIICLGIQGYYSYYQHKLTVQRKRKMDAARVK